MNAPKAKSRQTYKPIAALSRGLAVLYSMAREGASVADLAKRTNINRTTLYRILATLERDGYLTRTLTTHHYRLAAKIRRLSDGYTDSLWITQVAAPVLLQLLRDTAWPGSLATFDGRHMVLRETTHRFSSFFMHQPMVGCAMPLSTSLGQAFLAFSSRSIRRPVLKHFISDWRASGYGTLSHAAAETLLARVTSTGYATAINSIQPGVAAIARPIVLHDQVLACINVTMTPEVFRTAKLFAPIKEALEVAIQNVERTLHTSGHI
jgi:IclR family transcriptional regulator, mhp operon transcriptional activator